jgi:cyclic-di-GMP phosphodiesterase TipF (flagellum assembly factor)
MSASGVFVIPAVISMIVTGLALLIYELFIRRKFEQRLNQRLSYLQDTLDRFGRDVDRNRYYIARLRQAMGNNAPDLDIGGEVDEQAEKKLMDRAVDQLDTLVQSMEENAKAVTAAPSKRKSTQSDAQVAKMVRDAVKHNRIEVSRQPIVRLPQGKTRHYELFSRVKGDDGEYIDTGRFIRLASREDLLSSVDNVLLIKCMQMIRRSDDTDQSISYFCNISPQSLKDDRFINGLVDFLEGNPRLAPRIVFEMSQAHFNSFRLEKLPIMKGFAMMGCRFSMDKVKTLNLDISDLNGRFVSFIKIDSDIIMKMIKQPEGKKRLRQIKDTLSENGIEIIVEKIETAGEVDELMDLYIDLGQGYYFAKPSLVEIENE